MMRTLLDISPLFAGLDERRRTILSGIAVPRRAVRGESLFFAGDDAVGFYIVLSGRVKIYILSPAGREQILHIMQFGDTVGEVPVFAGDVYPANAEAIEDADLLYIPADEFYRLMAEDALLARNMATVLARRLIAITQLVESLALREVPGRLAAYLLHLTRRTGGGTVDLEIAKGQLAYLLGTTAETVSRTFARLQEDGIVTVQGRRITILDAAALADIAGDEVG